MASTGLRSDRPQPITLCSNEPKPGVDNTQTSPPATVSRKDEVVRVVFLGSAKVGKTSIIQRFLHNQFDPKYNPTVEDMHSKKIIVRDHLVPLVLVDTAGSFDFPAMLRLCISKASAFVLVFSHDNADSLIQASQVLNQIKAQRKDYAPLSSHFPNEKDDFGSMVPASPPITVVCNKSDLPLAHSHVSESVIMEWLLTNGLKPSQFVYASAKSNESILSIFKSLWMQNETTKAIALDSWDGARRASFYSKRPRTPPSTSLNDFSALNEVMTKPILEKNSAGQSTTETLNNLDKSAQRPRSSLFRSSLRLNRRSSSKSNKQKADIVQLDCVLS
ncbi:hypothetical protein EG68_01069 [Paragonimus skrjabini miyazakii]|uniref:Uncharacterized protein n=1 Tax=Paragonimus skrjabini miyazakii TaxID=59628 RepID=A0A8S9Z967_9TREM|nr:hypothetical protein EG68_01069 [Paragonimus skrjabini miyazakii]